MTVVSSVLRKNSDKYERLWYDLFRHFALKKEGERLCLITLTKKRLITLVT